jgi:hypothetical protein
MLEPLRPLRWAEGDLRAAKSSAQVRGSLLEEQIPLQKLRRTLGVTLSQQWFSGF